MSVTVTVAANGDLKGALQAFDFKSAECAEDFITELFVRFRRAKVAASIDGVAAEIVPAVGGRSYKICGDL